MTVEFAVVNTTTGRRLQAGHDVKGVHYDATVFESAEIAENVLRERLRNDNRMRLSAAQQQDDLRKAIQGGDMLKIANVFTYDMTRYYGKVWDDPDSIALAKYKIVRREVSDWIDD